MGELGFNTQGEAFGRPKAIESQNNFPGLTFIGETAYWIATYWKEANTSAKSWVLGQVGCLPYLPNAGAWLTSSLT